MDYIVKKSYELNYEEKLQLCNLFINIFEQDRSIKELEQIFLNNQKKYIYIALMLDENKIVGTMSVVPLSHKYYDKELFFGRGIDAMILKEYRGNLLNLKKMNDLLEEALKLDGIPFIFSAPNELNYQVRKRVCKWKDIHNLDIYVLPIKIGKIKGNLKYFNFMSLFYSKMANLIASKSFKINNRYDASIFNIVDKEFISFRFDKSYKIVFNDNGEYQFTYKIQAFNDINTIFILNLSTLNKSNLEYVVNFIYSKEKDIDLIAYFGKLDFHLRNLYKIPEKYRPKNTYFSGKILLPDLVDERIYNIDNWKFDLSNLDWI